jgi:protein SCO1/2
MNVERIEPMMSRMQKALTISLWALLVVATLLIVTTRLTRQPAGASVGGAAKLQPLYEVPEFELIDQDGKTVKTSDLRGKVWIADFIFTNCAGPCPVMTSKMVDLQKLLTRPDVKLVSFTVDPERDTPAVLKEYAKRFGADESRWSFLTGDAQRIAELARAMNVAARKEADATISHSTFFLLIDRSARVCGIYRTSEEDSTRKLADDATELADK